MPPTPLQIILKCHLGGEGGKISKNVSLTKVPEWGNYVGRMMFLDQFQRPLAAEFAKTLKTAKF